MRNITCASIRTRKCNIRLPRVSLCSFFSFFLSFSVLCPVAGKIPSRIPTRIVADRTKSRDASHTLLIGAIFACVKSTYVTESRLRRASDRPICFSFQARNKPRYITTNGTQRVPPIVTPVSPSFTRCSSIFSFTCGDVITPCENLFLTVRRAPSS